MSPPKQDWPTAGEWPDATESATAEGGGLRVSPTENKVCWQPPPREGRSCSDIVRAGAPALLWHPAGRARSPCRVEVHVPHAVPCAPCACNLSLCTVCCARCHTHTYTCLPCVPWLACSMRCALCHWCTLSLCSLVLCTIGRPLCCLCPRVCLPCLPVTTLNPLTCLNPKGGHSVYWSICYIIDPPLGEHETPMGIS